MSDEQRAKLKKGLLALAATSFAMLFIFGWVAAIGVLVLGIGTYFNTMYLWSDDDVA